jgi:hypothetical protein
MANRILILAALILGLALGQGANAAAVHVKLVNTTGAQVDYYTGGSPPKFVQSIPAGGSLDVHFEVGQVLLFGANRKLFQKFTVRSEAYQELSLALAGQQKAPKVSSIDPDAAPAPKPPKPKAKPQPEAVASEDTPATGADADGLLWQFNSFKQQAGGKKYHVQQLVYGIPETDAVKAIVMCTADPGSPDISLDLSSDVAKLKTGSSVKVDLAGAGFAKTLSATVLRSASGEGQEGFHLSLPSNDPLIVKLATLDVIKYGQHGGGLTSLPLASGRGAIKKFLAACSRPGQVTSKPDSDPAASSASLSCAASSKIKPVKSGEILKFTFKNASKEYRHVNVTNPSGEIIDNGGLDPGKTMQLQLRAGQVVQFTDGPGNCIEAAVVRKEQKIYSATKRSPGFGDGND